MTAEEPMRSTSGILLALMGIGGAHAAAGVGGARLPQHELGELAVEGDIRSVAFLPGGEGAE